MVVKHCSWGTCKHDSRYKEKYSEPNLNFIPFPKPGRLPEKCKRWIISCGRSGFSVGNVTQNTYICSVHFVGGKGPTDAFPDPLPAVTSGPEMEVFLKNKKRNRSRSKLRERGDQMETSHPKEVLEDSNQNIVEDEENIATCIQKPMMSDASCQTDLSLADMEQYSDQEIKSEKKMKIKFILADVLKDDKSCRYYTGVHLTMLMFLYNWLADKASRLNYWKGETTPRHTVNAQKGPDRALTVFQEFVLCLIRLRRGLDTKHLGNLFGISPGLVSRLLTTWINFLSLELKFLIRWPTIEQIHHHPPSVFRKFPKTRSIIDCTEFTAMRSKRPSSQRITWSSYKHSNTFKVLVSIDVFGNFSFVSSLWSGSISDKKIVEKSGYLDLISPGDDIMADRGFLIRDLLALRGATLNIPPFAMGKQLTPNAVTKTRRIAQARIHVERAIGRLKNFKLFEQAIPLCSKAIIDQSLVVCCALCNLDKPLVT